MPVHKMPPYKDCRHGDMSVTEDVAMRGINLPSSVGIKRDDISFICNLLRG